MGLKMIKCKKCGEKFHYCKSCDFEMCMFLDFCSGKCEKEKDQVKTLITLSKIFITNMKFLSGKYDFQSIEGVTKKFLKEHINELNKMYKRI